MSKSILLADDSATIRKVVDLIFSDTDYHIESVATGADALARIEILRPDLVLADVVMPGPTGYEICRTVKASSRPVPVLLLAGTFETFDHEQARECGADGCLLKPFDARTLLDRVASLLAEREAVNSSAVELVEPAPEPPVAPKPVPPIAPEPQEAAARVVPVADPPSTLDPEMVDSIAEAVVRRLSDEVVRELAREVLPRVAERVVRERIRELENEDS
jgi:CheY-like chemotaxis protein